MAYMTPPLYAKSVPFWGDPGEVCLIQVLNAG